MNDYRGITSAYQYGDSYLVLKDVRLRATFAATDSGGIAGSRLAVLDKYLGCPLGFLLISLINL